MTGAPGSLHVRTTGSDGGEEVLLLHSLFFDGSMFEELAGLLGDRHHCLAPDHRGQGASPDGPLGLEELAADAAALVEDRCSGPVHLVGSSMGGYVGTHLAATRPELVRTCALLGGTADAELDPAYFAALEAAIREGIDDDVVTRIEYTMFGDGHLSRPVDDPVRSRWRRRFAALRPRVADAAHAVFTRDPLHEAFAAVRAPVLLIAGESDHAKPPEHMARMAAAKPGARLAVLPGVGHTPAVEAPREVARLLAEHWSRDAIPVPHP
ncbi:alpha/beta hydrolase [Streptomyces sp. NPDC047000]|uniref:alpha/beta fold hydrolase n=1 Tax=Streptomyces sp. NPDC047000 TaxID=3155474 RepID=UPI0033E58470